MDRNRPVLGGPVRSPQYTGCGPRLPVLGAKNRTELNLQTLTTTMFIEVSLLFSNGPMV
ncbi:hypothetical protein K443DRAFT_90649 [Laccaria amethystina LaAM-08-1]|uniref:Uncharacterized protein n=1 Tax=Laccaria amethystina LaAM-08-1 TaxID=1095629 RepID=A0A0C9Y6H2_9AGAR|nr:hypothetical protein K443DRAFT_90649 [Laccaria amethystina LaAM-08-1]